MKFKRKWFKVSMVFIQYTVFLPSPLMLLKNKTCPFGFLHSTYAFSLKFFRGHFNTSVSPSATVRNFVAKQSLMPVQKEKKQVRIIKF